jgi:uncharacterized membrane protein YraQ (UPF0718 family)
MHDFVSNVGHALLLAFGMFWKTGWSLVLGFTISAALQAFVSTDQIRRVLGRDGPKEIALATITGYPRLTAAMFGASGTACLIYVNAAAAPKLEDKNLSDGLMAPRRPASPR